MAFPSSADIDTTKLDNDNDSIKDSRAELHKMAGYVNDIITEGPAGIGTQDQLEIGENSTDPAQIYPNQDAASKGLELYGRSFSSNTPSLSLSSDGTITLGGLTVFVNAALLVYNRTTTQRAAISNVSNGMIIYNTTDHKFQGYANGAWVDLH